MFSGSPPRTTNNSPILHPDAFLPQTTSPTTPLFEAGTSQSTFFRTVSTTTAGSYSEGLFPAMTSPNQEFASIDEYVHSAEFQPHLFHSEAFSLEPDTDIPPSSCTIPTSYPLISPLETTNLTVPKPSIPQADPLFTAAFTQPYSSQAGTTPSEKPHYAPTILPAIKQESHGATISGDLTTPHQQRYFAAFSAASEQQGEGIAVKIKPTPGRQLYKQESSVSIDNAGASLRQASIPDIFNPEKATNIDELISHIENEVYQKNLEGYLSSLHSIKYGVSAFTTASSTIGNPALSKKYLKAIKKKIRKYTNKLSAQESRRKKKKHMNDLETDNRFLRAKLSETALKTNELTESLKDTPIPSAASLKLTELQTLTAPWGNTT